MSVPSRRQVLSLYRSLLRYGEQLKLTDRDFYVARIQREVRENSQLTDQPAIRRSYEVIFGLFCCLLWQLNVDVEQQKWP